MKTTILTDLKGIDLDITKIKVPQKFGYQNIYWKTELLKHKRKTINGKSYDTKKSTLVFYKNDGDYDNQFNVIFIYKFENEYFRRMFTRDGESTLELINEERVLGYINRNKSLF